jgi:putative ATP-binding cassette transporter
MKINRLFTRNRNDIRDLMNQGKMPGASIIVIDGEEVFIKNFGYADLERKIPVTSRTLFELASCSKAFTALGMLILEEEGAIDLDEPVSTYLPWFYARYRGRKTRVIRVRHLLYHTSGIHWKSIAEIPAGDDPDALEHTARSIAGIRLLYRPGSRFSYATVNYDILGAVIEVVSGLSYEEFMRRKVFEPLGLHHTVVAAARDVPAAAAGYKPGLFKPYRFIAPPYRGNAPAAYIISNAEDMVRWLRLQLGLEESPLMSLILKTHEPDESVPPNWYTGARFSPGWQVSENDRVNFSGLNPNFSCEINLRPRRNRAVAVLCNCSGGYSIFLARYIRGLLFDEQSMLLYFIPGYLTPISSYAAVVLLGFYIVIPLGIIIAMLSGVLSRSVFFRPVGMSIVFRILGVGAGVAAGLAAGWLLPGLKRKYFWKTLIVWKPPIFLAALRLFLASVGLSYIAYVLSILL